MQIFGDSSVPGSDPSFRKLGAVFNVAALLDLYAFPREAISSEKG